MTASEKAALAAKLEQVENEGVITEPESFKNSGPPYYYKVPEKTFNELKAALESSTPDKSLKALEAAVKALIHIYSESIRLDHEDRDSFVCPVLEEISDLKMKMLHALSPADEDGQDEIEQSIREELRTEESKLITAATAQKEPKEMRAE